jgi:hypothetical protein
VKTQYRNLTISHREYKISVDSYDYISEDQSEKHSSYFNTFGKLFDKNLRKQEDKIPDNLKLFNFTPEVYLIVLREE